MSNEDMIIGILKEKGNSTTSEIEAEFGKKGQDCPDGAVKTLMRLKMKGRIIGTMDRARKGWVWSLKTSD